MTEYDITGRLSQYLDPHMVLPLIEWIEEKGFYSKNSVLQSKIDLVSHTKMIDFAAQEHQQLHGKKPDNLEQSKQEVYSELSHIQQSMGKLITLLNEDTVADLMRQKNWTLEYLSREYGISNENVVQFFKYAKATFECGDYKSARDLLTWFKQLIPTGPIREGTEMLNWEEYRFNASWGKLSAEILTNNFESALQEWIQLKDMIETRSTISGIVNATPVHQLQQRVWLSHWSLFIFFNLPDGTNRMLDLLLNDKLLAAISNLAPHLLRYLCVAAIFNRRRRNVLTDLARTVAAVKEKHIYTDPIIEFITATINEFDFDKAAEELKKIQTLVQYDFFLSGYIADTLVQNSKLLLFETYTRIYKYIDVTAWSQRFGIPLNESELKLVEYIRSSKIDAKIDSKNNLVVVATPYPTIYQQVIDKTKSLAYRSSQLAQALDKRFATFKEERD